MADRSKAQVIIKQRKELWDIVRQIEAIEAKIAKNDQKIIRRSVVQTMGADYCGRCHSSLYFNMPAVPRLGKPGQGGYCIVCKHSLPDAADDDDLAYA